MQILILGANGYIGTNFINNILENNNDIIIKLIDVFEPSREIIDDERITFFKGDINTISNLENILEGISIVFHFSGKSMVRRGIELFSSDFHNDVCGTFRILDAMTKRNVKKIVFISSGGTVYGKTNKLPINENVPLMPISTYGLVKTTLENILKFYNDNFLTDSITLRVSSLYGPNYNKIGKQGVIPSFINEIKNHKEITVYGTGEEVRDFLYIDDLISLLVSLLNNNFKGEIYNIGSGVGVSINKIIKILSDLSEEKININYMNKSQNDVENNVLDISKVKKKLGWVPKIDINEGIKRIWDSY